MQSHDHSSDRTHPKTAFLTSPAGLVFAGFLAIAGIYFWIEHRAHLLGALFWLPLLACPLMHIFMHHGHGDRAKPAASNLPPHDGASS
jgi:DUF2933 family protein